MDFLRTVITQHYFISTNKSIKQDQLMIKITEFGEITEFSEIILIKISYDF